MTITNPSPILPATTPGWLLAEDQALRAKLAGLQVWNERGGLSSQAVKTWYRFPDPEFVDQRTFPHITLDLIDIQFDATRAARAFQTYLDYVPAGASPPVANQLIAQPDLPLPWALIYQLTAFSREPLQDRQLSAQMIALFPQQFGFLDMTAIDGSVRRADLVGMAKMDRIDEENKRLFQKVFTVSVSSELSLQAAQTIWTVFEKAVLTMNQFDIFNPISKALPARSENVTILPK